VRMILEGKASVVAGVLRRMATQRGLHGSKREAVEKAADYTNATKILLFLL
jgi:hypothetical protein